VDVREREQELGPAGMGVPRPPPRWAMTGVLVMSTALNPMKTRTRRMKSPDDLMRAICHVRDGGGTPGRPELALQLENRSHGLCTKSVTWLLTIAGWRGYAASSLLQGCLTLKGGHMPDNTSKPASSADNDQSESKVDDLPGKPITEKDANAVKGGGATPHMIDQKKTVGW